MRLRLQTRFSLYTGLLIVGIVAILAASLMLQFRSAFVDLTDTSREAYSRHLQRQMVQRGEVVVLGLAANLINPLYRYDMEAMHRLLSVVLQQADVTEVLVYNNAGEIVHDGDEAIPRFGERLVDPLTRETLEAGRRSVSRVQAGVLESASAIWLGDEPIGGVKIVLSMERMAKDIARVNHSLALIGKASLGESITAVTLAALMLLIVGIGAAFLVAKGLARPLATLTAHTGQIAKGRYPDRVKLSSKDELGDLAQAFNQMTDTLERTTVSRNHLNNIIGSMSDALAVLDDQRTIQIVNPSLLAWLGYDETALVGIEVGRLFPREDSRAVRLWLDTIRTGGPVTGVDWNYRRKDGSNLPVSLSAAVLGDGDGGTVGFVLVAQDMSERVAVQQEMQRAKEAAEAASEAKTLFLARMSHEIRTPMNGVLGLTEILLDTKLDDQQRHLATQAYGSAEALLSIINDVLDFSKIEAHKLRLETLPFDLHETVEEATTLLGENARAKGLNLNYMLAPEVPERVCGDPTRLRQILTNLLANAIKFTDQGEVALWVSVDEASEDDALVRFTVEDSGIGVAPELRTHIFESFAQADGSMTRRYGGTGLGLAISKQLAESMGGSIGVEPRQAGGSHFWFTARLELQGAEETASPPASARFERVLVVDSNATNRRIQHTLLDAWGIEHDCAADGREALTLLHEATAKGEAFDLVMLDPIVPDMNGLAVARSIRSSPGLADTELLIMSSADSDMGAEFQALGVSAYIHKPVPRSRFRAFLFDGAGQEMEEPTAETGSCAARVLLTEDDSVNQFAARTMLESLGCQVDTAENGERAIAALQEDDYDLVFMDCQMPVMDGFEATRRIRDLETRAGNPGGKARRVPIIALTANAMEGDRERCVAAGMDDYLSKPFKRAELCGMLQRWLRNRPPELPASTNLPAAQVNDPGPEDKPPLPPAGIDEGPLKMLAGLRREGGPDPVRQVIEVYLKSTPDLCHEIRSGLAEGNHERVFQGAHALKSSSANVGAMRLAEQSRAIEMLARAERLGEVSEARMADLEDELTGVCDKLSARI